MKRKTTLNRQTKETQIELKLEVDGTGKSKINIPIGFLSHMLELFTYHGKFNLSIKAAGDINVDEHHLVEDIGITLGLAFNKALDKKQGIIRYGFFILPMDEVLATVAVDFAGRCAFNFKGKFKREKVGDLPTELVYDFWDAFAKNAKINLFIKVENGRNDHHQIEAVFKATAKAVKKACQIDQDNRANIPSTKGVL